MEPSSEANPVTSLPGQPEKTTPATPAEQTPPSREPAPAPRRRGFNLNLPPQPAKPPRKGTIFHLEVVFAVAVILATLFTAWTPGRQSPLLVLHENITQPLYRPQLSSWAANRHPQNPPGAMSPAIENDSAQSVPADSKKSI
jgi:hypothetical protein